jgi:chemotaxis protein MotB
MDNNHHSYGEAEEESYFISMTDMMVGMLFIFIMIMMYYALQVRIIVDGATTTRETRVQIIKDIVEEVREGGVEVDEDADNGIIRLKNNVLFASGDANVSQQGKAALGVLAKAILTHTTCHTFMQGLERSKDDCVGKKHQIDAIFVEGHTDTDPINNGRMRDNWDLSVARSTNTYRELVGAEPDLSLLRNDPVNNANANPQSVLSVAGYSSERQVALEVNEVSKSLNRRIDIRIIMKAPEVTISKKVEAEIPDVVKP